MSCNYLFNKTTFKPKILVNMVQVNKNGRSFDLIYIEHMLHYENLENVLMNGLLSHNEAYRLKLINKDISMPEVQVRRAGKTLPINGKDISIHDFVSLYFNSRNPMMYAIKDKRDELVVILISADIIDSTFQEPKFAIFTNGNAASGNTSFYIGVSKLENVPLEVIFGFERVEDQSEWKRKMCSEVLVYPSVPVSDIQKIICPNQNMYDFTNKLIVKIGHSVAHIVVEINATYFF